MMRLPHRTGPEVASHDARSGTMGPMPMIERMPVHTIVVAVFVAALALLFVGGADAKGSGSHSGGHSSGGHSGGHSSSRSAVSHAGGHSASGSHGNAGGSQAHSGSKALHGSKSPGHSSAATGHTPTSKRAAQGVTRDSHGKIARSAKAKDEFKRANPCPSTGKRSGACPGYVIDHRQALKHGGADTPSNMQWETVQEAKIKDRTE
jgi:hypothetical protein